MGGVGGDWKDCSTRCLTCWLKRLRRGWAAAACGGAVAARGGRAAVAGLVVAVLGVAARGGAADDKMICTYIE